MAETAKSTQETAKNVQETGKNTQEEEEEKEEELTPFQKARTKLVEIEDQLEKLNAERAAAKGGQDLQKICIEIASKYAELVETKKELAPGGAFGGTLKVFEYRALFLKNTSGLVDVLTLIKEAYGIETERIELQDEEIVFDDGSSKKFKYFEIECGDGKMRRIYTFLLQSKELAPRYAGDLFDLNSVKKGSWILYWHPYAMQLVQLSKFKNFYPIVWHNNAEKEKYIRSKLFFNDETELRYYMWQVEKYNEERILPRKQFRDNAIAKKEEMRERREAQRDDRGGSDRRERRRDSDEGDRPRRQNDQDNRRPRNEPRDNRRDQPRQNNRRDDRQDTRQDNRPQPPRAQNNRPSQSWATTAKGKPNNTKQSKSHEHAPAKKEGAWHIPQEHHDSEEEPYIPDQHDSDDLETKLQQQVPVVQAPMPFFGQPAIFQAPYGYSPQMPAQVPASQFSPAQIQQMMQIMQMMQMQQPQQNGQ
jgi:hypothetical protein